MRPAGGRPGSAAGCGRRAAPPRAPSSSTSGRGRGGRKGRLGAGGAAAAGGAVAQGLVRLRERGRLRVRGTAADGRADTATAAAAGAGVPGRVFEGASSRATCPKIVRNRLNGYKKRCGAGRVSRHDKS